MIRRATLECKACETRVVTRTAVGHGHNQTHTYSCPGCGVPIVFTLNIDHKNIRFEYGQNPTNANWVEDEEGAVVAVTFDSEALLPCGAPLVTPVDAATVSPFLMMAMLFRDMREFKREFNEQLIVIDHRDAIDRLLVHLESRNWDLLRVELRRLGVEDAKPDSDTRDLLYCVQGLIAKTQRVLIKDCETGRTNAVNLFVGALKRHTAPTEAFLREYRTSKRLFSLWHQARKARYDFLSSAHSLIPVLQLKHWRTPPPSLSDCIVLNKQFEALKQLYIDCFETLARLSVILLGLHYLGANGSADVPTRRGSISIWEFEKLPNANKPDHLARVQNCAFLVPVLDTALRNGIGHNSARYDALTDEVVIYKQNDAALEESRLPYTVFVDRVLDAASWLLELHLVLFLLLDANEEALG